MKQGSRLGHFSAKDNFFRGFLKSISSLVGASALGGCALGSALTFHGDANSRRIVGQKIDGHEIVEESVKLDGPYCYDTDKENLALSAAPAAAALAIDLAKSAAQGYLKKHNDKFTKTYAARRNFEGAYAPESGECLFMLSRSLKVAGYQEDALASAYLLILKPVGDAHDITVRPVFFRYGAALTRNEKPVNVAISLRLHSKSDKLLDDTVSLGAIRLVDEQPIHTFSPEEGYTSSNRVGASHADASSVVFKGFPFRKPQTCPAASPEKPGEGETPKTPACAGPQGFTLLAAVTEKGSGAPDYDANPELDAVAKFLKEIAK